MESAPRIRIRGRSEKLGVSGAALLGLVALVVLVLSVQVGLATPSSARAPFGDGMRAAVVASPQSRGVTTGPLVPSAGKVLTTIDVGDSPQGLAVSANGTVYVTNFGTDSVSVIHDYIVVRTVKVESGPYGVTIDAVNGYAYVTNSGSDSVSVIDYDHVIKTIHGLGTQPFGATFDASNGDVYVANYGSNNVSVISGFKVIASVPVGDTPQRLAYDTGNAYVYVTNYNSDNVTVLHNRKVVANVKVGLSPQGIAYQSNNEEVYVANGGAATVSIINGTHRNGTVHVGTDPYGVTADPYGDVYVANYGSDTVSEIYRSSVTGAFKVSSSPYDVVFNGNDGLVYASDPLSRLVWVLGNPRPLGTVFNFEPGSMTTGPGTGETIAGNGCNSGDYCGIAEFGVVESNISARFVTLHINNASGAWYPNIEGYALLGPSSEIPLVYSLGANETKWSADGANANAFLASSMWFEVDFGPTAPPGSDYVLVATGTGVFAGTVNAIIP